MAYESVLLVAVAFFAMSVFQFATAGSAPYGWILTALHIYLAATFAVYFLWCWLRGGQTLAMKAWGIRLIASGESRLTAGVALIRLLLAFIFVGSFYLFLGLFFFAAFKIGHQPTPWLAIATFAVSSIGLGWALFDRDRQFLYDRLAGTRLVLVDKNLTL
jgi:uncharacterized RDD family membrane protein YckC